MLTVLTSSTDDKLTTLATLKSQLGVTSQSTQDDDTMTSFIRMASDACARYIGYWPLRQMYRESIKTFGGLRAMVSCTPIRGVYSIYVGAAILDPASFEIENAEAGFLYRELGWPWSAGLEWDMEAHVVPHSETPRFSVTYEAGYILAEQASPLGFIATSGGRTLPADLEQAALIASRNYWLARKREDGIVSRTVGDFSITYQLKNEMIGPTALPPTAMALLERYRRIK